MQKYPIYMSIREYKQRSTRSPRNIKVTGRFNRKDKVVLIFNSIDYNITFFH